LNEELADMLREYGYTITTQNYYPDLQRVRRESKAILKHHQRDKNSQNRKKEEFTKLVMRYLAFLCTVLGGLDFDYNTVTYTKVMAHKTSI
jgi:hypothetical protein